MVLTLHCNCVDSKKKQLQNSGWEMSHRNIRRPRRSCDVCYAEPLQITNIHQHVTPNTRNEIVTDLPIAFLGNGSVNTFQRATMEDVSQWTNLTARY
jgi:hypothetical protein